MEDSSKKHLSRRGFLKYAATVGTALAVTPVWDKLQAANQAVSGSSASVKERGNGLPHRILGTGKAAFEVSALGFGVMGMTYNRSQHPDKKQCIRLRMRRWTEVSRCLIRPSSMVH